MQIQKPLLFGLLLALLPSCQSDPAPSQAWDHWNAASVPPRVERFFLGYDSDKDGPYVDKLKADTEHVGQFMQRAFLNRNTDNPFQD